MQVNVHRAYRQWAGETAHPYDAEDAYCAGYELALRVRDEERRGEDNPVVKSLRSIAGLAFPFR